MSKDNNSASSQNRDLFIKEVHEILAVGDPDELKALEARFDKIKTNKAAVTSQTSADDDNVMLAIEPTGVQTADGKWFYVSPQVKVTKGMRVAFDVPKFPSSEPEVKSAMEEVD